MAFALRPQKRNYPIVHLIRKKRSPRPKLSPRDKEHLHVAQKIPCAQPLYTTDALSLHYFPISKKSKNPSLSSLSRASSANARVVASSLASPNERIGVRFFGSIDQRRSS